MQCIWEVRCLGHGLMRTMQMMEQMLSAIDYAHLHGRKLYMTVNTLLKNTEIERQLTEYIRPFYEQGLDAVIVQDLGVMTLIRYPFPGYGDSCQYPDDGVRDTIR